MERSRWLLEKAAAEVFLTGEDPLLTLIVKCSADIGETLQKRAYGTTDLIKQASEEIELENKIEEFYLMAKQAGLSDYQIYLIAKEAGNWGETLKAGLGKLKEVTHGVVNKGKEIFSGAKKSLMDARFSKRLGEINTLKARNLQEEYLRTGKIGGREISPEEAERLIKQTDYNATLAEHQRWHKSYFAGADSVPKEMPGPVISPSLDSDVLMNAATRAKSPKFVAKTGEKQLQDAVNETIPKNSTTPQEKPFKKVEQDKNWGVKNPNPKGGEQELKDATKDVTQQGTKKAKNEPGLYDKALGWGKQHPWGAFGVGAGTAVGTIGTGKLIFDND